LSISREAKPRKRRRMSGKKVPSKFPDYDEQFSTPRGSTSDLTDASKSATWDFLASKLRAAKNQATVAPALSDREKERERSRQQRAAYTQQCHDKHGDVDMTAAGDRHALGNDQLLDKSDAASTSSAQPNPYYKGSEKTARKDEVLVISDKDCKTEDSDDDLYKEMKKTKSPVVGLDKIIEYTDPDGASCRVYHCTLCNIWRSSENIFEHITSYRHRVRYIGSKFSHDVKGFLHPDKKTINHNKGMEHRAAKRCVDLELVYGRGDIVKKSFVPEVPEDALDAPEATDLLYVEEKQANSFLEIVVKGLAKVVLKTDEDIQRAEKINEILFDALIEYKAKNKV
jgi:hypothetical protein